MTLKAICRTIKKCGTACLLDKKIIDLMICIVSANYFKYENHNGIYTTTYKNIYAPDFIIIDKMISWGENQYSTIYTINGMIISYFGKFDARETSIVFRKNVMLLKNLIIESLDKVSLSQMLNIIREENEYHKNTIGYC